MATLKQTDLSGGILRPELWGRTDLKKYPSFVKRAENFYVSPTGSLMNRPGTSYLAPTKGNVAARLIPFIFGGNQNYVLEFTALAVRIMLNGAILQNTGVDVVIVTTYTVQDIAALKYAQVGDELYIACPGKPVRKIQRLGALNWVIVNQTFTRQTTAPGTLAFVSVLQQTDDATHVAKEWQWKVTAWNATLTDESPASAALTPGGNGKCVVSDDKPVILSWGAVAGSARYSIYRGRNGLFGYVGDAVGQTVFRDDGQVPVVSEGPPLNRDPTAGSQYPAALGFYQQRLAIANQPNAPEWLYLSRAGAFGNFDYQEPAKADDSLDFGVANREYEEIRNLAYVDSHFLILTNGAAWVATGSDGGPLAADDSPFLRPQAQWGSSWLDCLVVGRSILFQVDGGYPIRSLDLDVQTTGEVWGTRDLSLYAGLQQDYPLLGWCFQRRPHRLVWGYDLWGSLATLTFDSETGTYAWTKHFLTGGRVVSMCSVPEGVEDVVYMVVARTTGIAGAAVSYYIERMAGRRDDYPALTDNNYLDCAIHFDGSNTDAANRLTLSGGNYTVGATVTVTAEKATFAAADVGDRIVLHPGDMKHRVTIQITGYTSATIVTGTILAGSYVAADPKWDVNQAGITAWTGALGAQPPWTRPPGDYSDTVYPMSRADWGFARSQFQVGTIYSPVSVLSAKGDGNCYSPVSVVAQKVTLPVPAVFVSIGVAYRQLLETLDLTSPPGTPDTTLNTKILKKAALEISNTSPGFQLGQDPEGALTPWAPEPGEVSTAEFGYGSDDLTYSGLAYAPVYSAWDRNGRMCLVNTNPLPVTVTAIVREVEYGGT